MSVVDVPDNVTIPSGFREEIIEINGQPVSGFMDKEEDFVCYLKDENGNAGFFRYDEETGMFYEYVSVDKTPEKIYSALFRVFLWITIIESVFIILIIYIIKHILRKKTHPRPRRV